MERLTEWRNGHGAVVNNRENYIDKLAQYEDAEESGLLVRLPCKVGDTVYWVPNLSGDIILTDTISAICLYRRNYLRVVLPKVDVEPIYPNAHLFITREEAEKALEGLKCLK